MEPLNVSTREAAKLLGLGKTSIYRLINEGALTRIRLGRRTLVTTASIKALIDFHSAEQGEG